MSLPRTRRASPALENCRRVVASEEDLAGNDLVPWREQSDFIDSAVARLAAAALAHQSEQLSAIEMKTDALNRAHQTLAGLKMCAEIFDFQ